jgi:hypothetical protein
LGELLGAQCGLDLLGPLDNVATPGASQRRDDLGPGQPSRSGRVGCLPEQLECITTGQVVEGNQGGGEELLQGVAQSLHMTSAFPDQRLVSPGDHLDRLGQLAVTSHLPQLMGVGADHVGQRVRVPGVALGS